jgi:FKBP-type peptidyl-prolyl cis-trans isomerase FklB
LVSGSAKTGRQSATTAFAGLALVSIVAGFARAEPPKETVARASYSLGHQIGMDLARQGRAVDVESLRRGLLDALAGRVPALSDAERTALLVGLKRNIVTAEREDRIRGMSSLRQAGAAFMAENAQKEGVIELPSGLQYRVIRAGTGLRPGPDDRVTVRYRSTRLDGAAFHDSTREGAAPETFRVSGLVPGLTEALQLMPEGSRWEIFLPPDLAFGRRGPLQDQTVIYDLDLLEVLPADAAFREGES